MVFVVFDGSTSATFAFTDFDAVDVRYGPHYTTWAFAKDGKVTREFRLSDRHTASIRYDHMP